MLAAKLNWSCFEQAVENRDLRFINGMLKVLREAGPT